MLVFEAVRATGDPGKHIASFPRQLVTSSEARSTSLGLFVKIQIKVDGLTQPLNLTFAPIPSAYRSVGRQLADTLPRSAA